MKEGKIFNSCHTIGYNVETVELEQYKLNLWDIGGGCKIKELSHIYCQDNDILLYFINGAL